MNHSITENNRLIENIEFNPLKGKTLAIIDADEHHIGRLQKTCQLYQAKLIVSNHEDSVPDTVLAADHILCYQNCPNPRLCEAAFENCAMFGKEVHLLEDDSLQGFSRQLAELSIEVKTPTEA